MEETVTISEYTRYTRQCHSGQDYFICFSDNICFSDKKIAKTVCAVERKNCTNTTAPRRHAAALSCAPIGCKVVRDWLRCRSIAVRSLTSLIRATGQNRGVPPRCRSSSIDPSAAVTVQATGPWCARPGWATQSTRLPAVTRGKGARISTSIYAACNVMAPVRFRKKFIRARSYGGHTRRSHGDSHL